jgi:hypothetical protein
MVYTMKIRSLLIVSVSILAIFPMSSSYAQHKHDHGGAQGQSLTPSSPNMNRPAPQTVQRTPRMGSMGAQTHMQSIPSQTPMKAAPLSNGKMGTHTHMQTMPQVTPGKTTRPLIATPSKGKPAPQLSKQAAPIAPLTKSRVSTGNKTTPKINTTTISPTPQVKPTVVATRPHLNTNEIRSHQFGLQQSMRTGTQIAGGNYNGRRYYGTDRYYGRDYYGPGHYYGGWDYGRSWENGFLEGALGTALVESFLNYPSAYSPVYTPYPYYTGGQIYTEQPPIIQQTIYVEEPDYLQQLEESPDYQAYTYSMLYGDNVYVPPSDVLLNQQDSQQQQRELLIQQIEQNLAGLNAEQFYASRPILNLTY